MPKFLYKDFDNIETISDNAGPSVSLTYDLMQRVVKKTVSDGSTSQVTQYSWDERDRLIAVTDPMGNKTQYNYEKTFIGCHIRDLPTAVIDPSGQKTRFIYDNQQRLIQKIEPNGSLTQLSYNPRGDLTAVSDPNGQRTTYRFFCPVQGYFRLPRSSYRESYFQEKYHYGFPTNWNCWVSSVFNGLGCNVPA